MYCIQDTDSILHYCRIYGDKAMQLLDSGSPPKTLEAFVADRLRQAILRGDFKPSERLDENAIAAQLEVSRTPVRAALRLLASESLVAVHPHRGTVVCELTADELEEVYLIRRILEGQAARLAAPCIDDSRLRAMEALLLELERTTQPDAWLELNNRFHCLIYEAAKRPRMLSIIEYVRNISAPYIRQFIQSPEHMAASGEQHRRVLAACAQRDGALAQAEIEQHLQAVAESHLDYVGSQVTP